MAVQPDYVTGTITLTNGSDQFTGASTAWKAAGFRPGDIIIDVTGATQYMGVIASITGEGAGMLTKAWEGPTLEDVDYRMRYQPDGSRVTAQSRNLVELLGNGNLQAVAGLDGNANQVLMFTGPGAMTTVPKTDLVSGAAYDVQVDEIADRDAYDAQAEGFAVLVADSGDGRAAIYSKNSATSGDWSDPAYVTGPAVTLDVGSVTPVAFGNDPDVTLTPIGGGYEFDFELPENATFQSGTITTLDPGEDATFSLSPVAGGYALNLGVPRGPTGDIDGVTSFWQGRITVDGTAEQALAGLGAMPASTQAIPNADYNQVEQPGFYAGPGSDAINGPPGSAAFGTLIAGYRVSGNRSQIAQRLDELHFRASSAGVFSDWATAWSNRNMPVASQAEVEAGTGTDVRAMTPQRLAQAIAALAWAAQPVGVPIPVWTHLDGVDEPPTDQSYRYIKLTASDAYNTGVLTGESVSGSAPLVIATAVIDDAESPLDGETVHLINTERRFLRAGSAGDVQNDQMQQIIGSLTRSPYAFIGTTSIVSAGALKVTEKSTSIYGTGAAGAGYDISFDSADSLGARTGSETRPKNIGVDYYMRIR